MSAFQFFENIPQNPIVRGQFSALVKVLIVSNLSNNPIISTVTVEKFNSSITSFFSIFYQILNDLCRGQLGGIAFICVRLCVYSFIFELLSIMNHDPYLIIHFMLLQWLA
jgi:hypothetical protein